MSAPTAAIYGCAGRALDADERAFFRAADPLGFILFARNCVDPGQLGALVASFRDAVGRADAPVLIDQEGGRVARLGPPHWRRPPAAARFAALARRDIEAAERAAWLNARLIAAELRALGITVDCTPVLDVPAPDGHEIIGDRAYGAEPGQIARLGRAVIDGLLAGGVAPVVKHIPGHGRARADSHHALPVVKASADELGAVDFAPFAACADAPFAMTAHVTYAALDASAPATFSNIVIGETIRNTIGFTGVLMSDDLSMGALDGAVGSRATRALEAGCDLVLHCNADAGEMAEIAPVVPRLDGAPAERVARALAVIDPPAELAALGALLGRGKA